MITNETLIKKNYKIMVKEDCKLYIKTIENHSYCFCEIQNVLFQIVIVNNDTNDSITLKFDEYWEIKHVENIKVPKQSKLAV